MIARVGHYAVYKCTMQCVYLGIVSKYMSITLLQATRSGTGESQARTTTKMHAQKAKALKMPTVHMLDKHPPELSSQSSKEETSSGADEYQPPATNHCRQIDLHQYPEARQELQDMEIFYTQEQNLRRKGVALKLETWRKTKIHILSESESE